MSSPFSALPPEQCVAENALAFAVRDRYPVSPGHTLVVPRREVSTWFEATTAERMALLELVDEVKAQLDAELRPDGYNVGFNVGEVAGQTVFHLHVHVIPRFRGDMDDPRGGVRHVIPGRGNYVRREQTLTVGGTDRFIGPLQSLLARAERVRVVSAFVQQSGVRRIRDVFEAALARGADIQLLTGDYLDITQAAALEELLDWATVGTGGDEADEVDDKAPAVTSSPPPARVGRLETRIVEVAGLKPSQVFHPKSWRLEGPGLSALFVGSSNLSWSALEGGVEWNLRIDRDRDPEAYGRAVEAFEAHWSNATPLDAAWLARYANRSRTSLQGSLPVGEVDPDPLPSVPDPHEVQREALDALERTRDVGHRRALTILATGLGKTWLAAFDVEQLGNALGRPPRMLFLAHRRELLRQAARVFRTLARARGLVARISWCIAATDDVSGDWVFASVAKLSRRERLQRLDPGAFDYVVVDEVHHATASSYRRILDHLDPVFTLGLTATPERADEADLLGLFDDNLVFRADLGRGIEVGRLVPFHYFGVKDEVDYTNIPWRNRRFDPEALMAAVQTERRMAKAWEAWQQHPGSRTLVFCASVAHANYSRDWLRARGVRVDALHTGEGADDREAALDRLQRGELDAVCSVDVLNEGVDVPSVDRVLMLRPTESPVVYLQQIGRGLRRAGPDKTALTIIDFVGNHRVFARRIRQLVDLATSSDPAAIIDELLTGDRTAMPTGCSIDLELEAKAVLRELLMGRSTHALDRYRRLREERDERPTAGELYRLGVNPRSVREAGGCDSWFELVGAEGDLDPAERRAAEALRPFLRDLETTAMTRSFKMITLEALLEAEALFEGLPVEELARRAHRVARRTPELWGDIAESHRFDRLEVANERRWLAYWKKNPIEAWTKARGKTKGRAWFSLDDGRFAPTFGVSDDEEREAGVRLVRELVDYRLAQYRARQPGEVGEGFEAKVSWNRRDPILMLPDRKARPDVPSGEIEVRLPTGEIWVFRMVKIACNWAAPVGTRQRNQLPDLLRAWFGPLAGQPGTTHRVRFAPSPDGWWLERLADVVPLPLGHVRSFPSLRAAAGAAPEGQEAVESETVALPGVTSPRPADPGREGPGDPNRFAVRADGASMDGGKAPIRDGDWVVMAWCRGQPLSAVEDRVVLVQTPDVDGTSRFQLKRVRRRGRGFELASDNPAYPSFEATGETVPIARLVDVVPPEALAPTEGASIEEERLSEAFGLEAEGLSGPPPRTGRGPPWSSRAGGHLFLFVDRPGALRAVDRLVADVRRAPGETAYILARAQPDAAWRYCGVGRFDAPTGSWTVPALDFASAKALGVGRAVSRTLPEHLRERASALIDELVHRTVQAGRSEIEVDGRRCRVLGPSERGGLRIDGGDGGFRERTVSPLDFGWCLFAIERARGRRSSQPVDEAGVNRTRYPEGTPKSSTRYIDTGWALRLLRWLEP